MKVCLLIFVFGTSLALFAKDKSYDQFIKNFRSLEGQYKVIKGGSLCSGGFLSAINGNLENGFHLGHDIVFGLRGDSKKEKIKDYCTIDTTYSFTSNSVTLVTQISQCPTNLKNDESITTKGFSFKDGVITYSIKESNLNCVFKKISQKSEE